MKSTRLFILFITGILAITQGCTEKSSQIQTNKKIARSFVEAWSLKDGDMLASLFADSLLYVEVPSGRIFKNKLEIGNYVTATCYGMPDTESEVVSVIANEKMAAIEWIMKGTNTVGWPNIPATNRYFELKVASVMEIKNNLIIANRDYWDFKTFIESVGPEVER